MIFFNRMTAQFLDPNFSYIDKIHVKFATCRYHNWDWI